MDRRLRGDVSLKSRAHDDGEAADALDRLVEPSPGHDTKMAEDQELARRRHALKAAIQTLSAREKHIFMARYLTESSPKLETLAAEYGISRERVRQIEQRSFEKVRSAIQAAESLPKGLRQHCQER